MNSDNNNFQKEEKDVITLTPTNTESPNSDEKINWNLDDYEKYSQKQINNNYSEIDLPKKPFNWNQFFIVFLLMVII